MEFDLETIFTRKDYRELVKAVRERTNYEFLYSKKGTCLPHPSTGLFLHVNGRKCDNGVWKDNYLYGFDCWYKNGGMGRPYDPVDGIIPYERFIEDIYSGLNLTPPKTRQLTFMDLEM